MTFYKNISNSVNNITKNLLMGKFALNLSDSETHLVEDGISVFLGENKFTTTKEQVRKISTVAPNASILIKKKAFSTFKQSNDIRWLDRTERTLLRATKALFAFKVCQIRTYEAMSKFENYFTEYKEVNLRLLMDVLNNAKYFDIIDPDIEIKSADAFSLIKGAINSVLTELENQKVKDDVLRILQRTAFSGDTGLTTWYVDPLNVDDFGTGPGTGVIELATYSSFNCTSSTAMEPSSASFSFLDPYRISYVTEEEIEIAIEEALFGTIGLFEDLATGTGGSKKIYDGISSVASQIELLGLGALDSTINIDYIRQQLRKFYLGKSIINCGDGIHIFIRGNRYHASFEEQKYRGTTESTTDYSIDENILKAEWILYTDKKLSFETYKNLRLASHESFSMQHVFGGFIKSVSENYRVDSGWETSVSATNNMGWLEWSRYMTEPSLKNTLGVLEDPLTPYEIKTDYSGEVLSDRLILLPENQYLLQQGLLVYDNGILRGQAASEGNIIQGQYNGRGSLYGTKIVQHVDGFVYRWKTGIITATAGMSPGSDSKKNDKSVSALSSYFGITSAQDVLMNLDIANIISLLVVGQPYNVQSFLEQTYQAQTHYGNDRLSNSFASNSQELLLNVMDSIRKQNNYFGAFKPYRSITLGSAAYEQISDGSLYNSRRKESNSKISALRSRAAKLLDMIKGLSIQEEQNKRVIENLREEVSVINQTINEEVELISNSTSSDPLVTSFNLFGDRKTIPLSGDVDIDHEVTRAMSIVGAQRKIEDVRLNRDQNLLIISDQYDQDTDIRPFLLGLKDSNWKLFKGTYLDVYTKCKAAIDTANFEFFCNSQGHLEFRPPLWNRTPLSVLKAMMQLQKNNKNIVPQFLIDLLQTRITSIKREIHLNNIRLALLCLMMRRFPDKNLIPNMKKSGEDSLSFFGLNKNSIYGDDSGANRIASNALKTGVSGWVDKKLTSSRRGVLSLSFSSGGSGDILSGDTDTILGEFDPIFQQSANVITFSDQELSLNSTSSGPLKDILISDVDKIRKDFKKLAGRDPLSEYSEDLTEKDLLSDSLDSNDKKLQSANEFFEKIKQTISKRDGLVYALKRNEEKRKELFEIETMVSNLEIEQDQVNRSNSDSESSGVLSSIQNVNDWVALAANYAKSFSDILSGSANQGTIIDHLIENDDRNLLGPGSGKRYIIRDEDVVSMNFSETPPDFCRVDVVGTAPFVDLGNQTEDLYHWAGATDFDLWRQYGYKPKSISKLPYSSSAELQSKPFALMEIQTQKLAINRGSVTLVGNEYYQPGDTVYIPDKGMLYYVKEVTHSFSFGQTFTTQLDLIFGHVPGEYIPTPMDIIGQQYGIDPIQSKFLIYKGNVADNKYRPLQPDSNLIFPGQTITEDNLNVLLGYSNNQVRFLNMIFDLTTANIGDRYVVIRGFYKDENDLADVEQRVEIVKSLLIEPRQISRTDYPQDVISSLSDAENFVKDITEKTGATISSLRNIFKGGAVGNFREVVPLMLPNGLPARSTPPEKIILQFTKVGKERGAFSTQIKCLNPQIYSKLKFEDGNTLEDFNGDQLAEQLGLSIGGPKQSSWLDLRSDLTRVSNIVEIGIVDLKSV
jgi:hypothetical protein